MRGPDAHGKLVEACPAPCADCPWRTANQGKPHPDGWYTKRNLARLWTGLRRGESMSCHPTDPDNPIPEGGRVVPASSVAHECCGALILQQRELMKLQSCAEDMKMAWPKYRRECPMGLTKEGAFRVAARAAFGGVGFLISGPKMARPNLNQEVGYEPLGEWKAPT